MKNYYDTQLPDLPKSIPAHENKELLLPVNRHIGNDSLYFQAISYDAGITPASLPQITVLLP